MANRRALETEPAGADQFWTGKSLEQLASEQAVKPVRQLEDVLGRGAGLWKDEAEFNAFVQGVYGSRKGFP